MEDRAHVMINQSYTNTWWTESAWGLYDMITAVFVCNKKAHGCQKVLVLGLQHFHHQEERGRVWRSVTMVLQWFRIFLEYIIVACRRSNAGTPCLRQKLVIQIACRMRFIKAALDANVRENVRELPFAIEHSEIPVLAGYGATYRVNLVEFSMQSSSVFG